ncbi:primosomal protein N' [Campylobacter suis]|uniref:Replication restart protein PriA n=1 Tax=Campylobacter suis TaxID=2790657 RepID=A0ABN7K477_9BACT|nr:primosomal protein N' [Campylobacter suis]CAD7287255.1 Primosomal protein N' [Campylobacter suis]
MFYYLVSFFGKNLAPLTYESEQDIDEFTCVLAPIKGKDTKGVIVKKCDKPSFKTTNITEILPQKLTDTQRLLAEFIAHYYTCELGVSLGLFEPFKDVEKVAKKTNCTLVPKLNHIQQDALNFIQSNKTALLFGDTGSGKSEVYISAIQKVLQEKKQALFLMPEISLTPQMQTRLERYFGKSVATWHSKVSSKQKDEILQGLLDGSIWLIAGARSALFLPLEQLGLIIIDEEHDDSYKNTGSRPHYNARDLALFLNSKTQIKLVLGSATPSVSTFYKQATFRMKGSFFGSQKSFVYDESETGLTQNIKEQVAQTLANKRQAIICLPTRANFRYISCKECGNIVKCPFCSVGMSFYKGQNLLKCQYCEYKTPVPSSCEKCGSELLEAKKIGTSELLEQLSGEFANARIAKFDRDEITTQKKLVTALKDFNDQKIDILIGTQMLSKGHDYHNVDLAVIMGIDELLAYPDFRARERTLALAMQVAGRAGRAGAGRVVLQTKQREFFESYLHDYDKFLQDELEFRQELYPPFYRLLRLIVSHKSEQTAQLETNRCVEQISLLQKQLELSIIGYGKCAIERIGDKFRYEILLRSKNPNALLKVANICVSEICDVDIDPINFS